MQPEVRLARRRAALSVLILALTLLAPSLDAQQGVRWRSAPDAEPRVGQAEVAALLGQVLADGDRGHVVVHLDRTPLAHSRALLGRLGLELLRPLDERSWFAAVSAARLDVAGLLRVREFAGLSAIAPEWKQHPLLVADELPDWAFPAGRAGDDPTVALYVLFHADVELAEGEALAADLGAQVMDRLESLNGLVLELPRGAVAALTALDVVQWLEPPLPRMSGVNDSSSALTQADVVQAAPYGLDGSGVTVLVYDGGIARASHVDFGGRLSANDGSGLSDHATHVSATIGGSGAASGGTYEGMAPGVDLESYGFEYDGTSIFLYTNPGDLESDYDQAINVFGADVANNSISANTESNGFPCMIQGDYGVTSSLIDAIVRGSLGAPFRVVWANGNERQGSACDVEGFGDHYSMSPPATAKNHITVGALNSNDDSMTSFSSWGPTDDGRMKPDVCAPGCQSDGDFGVTSAGSASDTALSTKCGTSMASPTVAGLSALLMQDWRARFGGGDPRPATLKALLAHAAADRGNVGPDYEFGYGSVRIQDTIDFMRLGRFDEDELADQGATHVSTVSVQPGDPELVLTLAWDDPPAAPNVFGSLVNDLDLRVYDPGGVQHHAWSLDPAAPAAPAVRSAPNRLDNIEQVFVSAPAAGTWRVEVHGHALSVGPQPFSLTSSHDLTEGPFVDIGFPAGLPVSVLPGLGVTVTARITGVGETVVGGSPALRYRYDGGAFLALPLAPQGGDLYAASLPAPACGDTPEFYVTVTGSSSGAVSSPPDAPASAYASVVETVSVLHVDDFEADAGWTVVDTLVDAGGWERGVPAADGGRGDPLTDFDGSGACWLTGNGFDEDLDGGPTLLTSPAFDLSAATGDVDVSYAQWFANDDHDVDALVVEVSGDGGANWSTVEVVGNTSGWSQGGFRVTDFVGLTANVVVRFSVADQPNDSITEAALDAFVISESGCGGAAPLPFANLGNGLAGALGTPLLAGESTFVAGEDVSLALSGALPLTSTALVIGLSAVNLPLKGGVLVPAADVILPGLPIDGAGALDITFPWPAGVPAGVSTFYQHWVSDPGGPAGFAASNAVQGVTP